jgi:protein-tyrosine kinase
LGKIYDALEKSQNEKKPTVTSGKGSVVDFYKDKDRKREAVDLMQPMVIKENVNANLVTYLNPQSLESEMFKILRGNILFPTKGKPPRSILVTSALPGEGKSFVSTNLAVSIAQNINEHVLLMDCDIRKPSVHGYLGFDETPGLAEYLSEGRRLEDVLLKTDIKKLTVLPGGRPPHNPAELLSSREMSKLLQEVKQRYNDRYIIIDSPPPQLTAETNAIARQVDAIIIIVKYGSTPREIVEELVDTLGKEKIIGCVMNWFNLRSSTYYGYGKYGKYSKYYQKKLG